MGGPGWFPRPHPGVIPEFAPPHLRRQNANGNGNVGGGVGGGANRQAPPARLPPMFPFHEPFVGLNRNGFNRAPTPGAAGRRQNGAAQPNRGLTEGIPGFNGLRI